MYAVITAGGRVSGEFAAAIGTPVKALARVGNRTLLHCAIDAAREAGAAEVAVVGGPEVRQAASRDIDRFIPEAQSGAQNVHLALAAFPGQSLMYLSSDLPFISGTVLVEFLSRAPEGSLCMPLAQAAAYEQRFEAAPLHATVIGKERIANGSVFKIPAGGAEIIDSIAQRLFNARKDLLGMAKLMGPGLLLKFLCKQLTIADLETHAARVLGFPVFAARNCAPELCFDIDSIEDYTYALATFEKRAAVS
ncbi:MAG: NTP transferase domain-containing protein [Candidatus Eremiobacteraeota bacterium]|nr:NTP transferase domain-containing protein [Candidatus Eremiobacteraeota bacterium]